MRNLFEGAYFGKVYKTRDGRKAIYKSIHFRKSHTTDSSFQFHKLMVDGGDTDGNDIIAFMNNGKRGIRCQDIDIISEWKDTIDEKALDNLANECYYEMSKVANVNVADVKEAFKAGYKKAKED